MTYVLAFPYTRSLFLDDYESLYLNSGIKFPHGSLFSQAAVDGHIRRDDASLLPKGLFIHD